VTTGRFDVVVRAVTEIALVVAGVLLGVIGAFLVPARVLGGIEGLAAVVGLLGNLVLGLIGGVGSRRLRDALLPGIGWFVAVGALSTLQPGGDVVIPGRLDTDPGVTKVGTAFLLAGVVGTIVALLVTARFIRRAAAPTTSE